jgi:hypothetical protein
MAVKMRGNLTLLKMRYVEKYAACLPGIILIHRMIERTFQSHDTALVNYLTDLFWHRSWKMEKIKYYDLWVYPLRPISLIFRASVKKGKAAIREIKGLGIIYRYFGAMNRRRHQ